MIAATAGLATAVEEEETQAVRRLLLAKARRYNAMSSFFARDNVALLGFGKMFRRFADQNYGHALVFQVHCRATGTPALGARAAVFSTPGTGRNYWAGLSHPKLKSLAGSLPFERLLL